MAISSYTRDWEISAGRSVHEMSGGWVGHDRRALRLAPLGEERDVEGGR
jgi:hypothetical protein